MKEYGTHFMEWHPNTHDRDRSLPDMHEMLNRWAQAGWTLFDVKMVSIGFLAIFEREVPKKEENAHVPG